MNTFYAVTATGQTIAEVEAVTIYAAKLKAQRALNGKPGEYDWLLDAEQLMVSVHPDHRDSWIFWLVELARDRQNHDACHGVDHYCTMEDAITAGLRFVAAYKAYTAK